MSGAAYPPSQVIPPELAQALAELPFWFVIGGQAVRCFAPYRPSRDVDLGVDTPANLEAVLERLRGTGTVEVIEEERGTVHLLWDGVKVSVFVLDRLVPYVEQQRLTVAGILATKLHAILDRGLRRDFFDLYVMLQRQRLGIAECLAAIRTVYRSEVNDTLLLRALTYFDDAEREAPLPGEGPRDFAVVRDFFIERVGNLLVPPSRALDIQDHVVDVSGSPQGRPPRSRRTTGTRARRRAPAPKTP
jgi:hypothetical protein